MSRSLKVLALTCYGLVAALREPAAGLDFDRDDVITRDVCIIGGGSGGTYAATRLRQLGQSVIIVEKEPIMGGHTNTFTVPGSDLTIDYGVVVFHNTSIVRDYFAHYQVPLGPAGFAPPTSSFNIDFRTGQIVKGFVPPDPSAALLAWVNQLSKYPFLAVGIDLPDPVPTDLLLPFRDFVKKYDLANLVQTISNLGQGYADIINQPTLYAMKLLSLDLVQTLQTGFIASAKHDNHAIYDAATAYFTAQKSLLLSSYVSSVRRGCNSDGSSNIVIQTPKGKKLVKAKKIVVAVPPRISSFAGWDLDDKERFVFSTYRNEAYYTGLINNTGFPDGTAVTNIGANTPFNLPALPGMYGFSATAEPGLFDVKYASPFYQENGAVMRNILEALGRLQIPNIKTTPSKVQWAAFNAHVPFFEHVTAEQIKHGFYRKANALQGHRRVWYTGAAWEAQDSSMIWSFTESILPAILKA